MRAPDHLASPSRRHKRRPDSISCPSRVGVPQSRSHIRTLHKKDRMRRHVPCLAIIALALTSSVASAQITSGSVGGIVRDSAGMPVANAIVAITFGPTGQLVATRTRDDGRYGATNLRPGGPYTIVVSFIGFRADTASGLSVQLGATTARNFTLTRAAVRLTDVTVVADRTTEDKKEGTGTQVTALQLQQLPSIGRSLQDMTRLTPSGNGVSFAGSNYRYNNLTIDGAASNDAFGFSPSSGNSTATVPTGTPGGLSRTQPISLDAIEQVSVAIAPYDIRVGNFTGGSINAVTRAGSNTTSGSLYTFGRTPGLVGTGLSGSIPNDFKDYQIGGRLGGKIIENKLFYFLNAEVSRRDDPVLFAPGTNGALLTQAVAQQVHDSLQVFAARSGVNFDPGSISNYHINANSEKYFARIDANLGTSILTVRDNFVNAVAGNLERGQALNKLASQDYLHYSKTNSLVGELKTQFNGSLSNSLIAGYSVVSDHRTPYGSQISPQIEIADIQYGQINAGSDRESAVYKQKTSTIELTDNLTYTAGMNTVTLGTHNEFYKVQYTFLNSYNGRWQYPNLAAFLAQKPNRIRATYSQGDNSLAGVSSKPGADFNVITPSFYAQDELALATNFKLTLGLRVDATSTDQATQSAAFTSFVAADGTKPWSKYTDDYGSSLVVAPRLGFSWDAKSDQSIIVRGGAGVFQGRMPFAWFAYPYLNNGTQFTNVDYRPTYTSTLTSVPLIVDPSKQGTLNTLYSQGSVYEINVIDNKYVQPQMARGNLGFDFVLPWQSALTLEGTYTKTLKDIIYTNQDIPTSSGNLGGADQRPIYPATRLTAATGTAANPFSAVYVLGNTTKGFRYNTTIDLKKHFGSALDLDAAYTYGQSKDVANGQRNSPQSNVEYNQLVVANQYPLTWSNYDVRHRIVGSASWNHAWNSRTGTNASLVYTGQSGSPFSYVYSGDLNNDGSSNNDLIYIPKTASDITLIPSARPTGQTDTRTPAQIWEQLDAFISSDPYLNSHRGQVSERNGARTPWNHRVDLRVAQDIHLTQGATPHNLQVTLDVVNLGNLLNKSWGKYYFVPNLNNQNVYPLAYRSGRAVGAVPSFSFDPIAGKPYQTDDLQSRWQMQAGMRYTF